MMLSLPQVMDRLFVMMSGPVVTMGGPVVMMTRPVIVLVYRLKISALGRLDGLLLSEGRAADSNRASGNHASHGKSRESLLDHNLLRIGKAS